MHIKINAVDVYREPVMNIQFQHFTQWLQKHTPVNKALQDPQDDTNFVHLKVLSSTSIKCLHLSA